MYRVCLYIANTALFGFFINLCILLNTIVLAYDKHPVNELLMEKFELINLFFFFVFLVEMIIKMLGFGFKYYFKDRFNTFDALIVAISIIDVTMFYTSIVGSGGGAVTALRAFRFLRVFKLAKSWKKLQDIMRTIGATINDVSNFAVLLFLFIFTYSLLGMEMFSYEAKFNANDELDLINGSFPDSTFNEFIEAFVSVFIVLANDGWTTIFFNHYRSSGATLSVCYFISLYIIGSLIMINLFLAVLLHNFDEVSVFETEERRSEEQKAENNPDQKQKEKSHSSISIFSCLKSCRKRIKRNTSDSLNIGK